MNKRLLSTYNKYKDSEELVKIDNIFKVKQYLKYIAWSDRNNNILDTYYIFVGNYNYANIYDILSNYDFLKFMLEELKKCDEDEISFSKSDFVFITLETTLKEYTL